MDASLRPAAPSSCLELHQQEAAAAVQGSTLQSLWGMTVSIPVAAVQKPSHAKGSSANTEATTQQLQQPEEHNSQGPPEQAQQPQVAPIQPPSALAGLHTAAEEGADADMDDVSDVQPPLKQRCQQQTPSWVTEGVQLGWQLLQLW
jgi:hypothetical protein